MSENVAKIVRPKANYEAMQWKPTQEVFERFCEWMPGFFDWKPDETFLVVVLQDDGTTRTEMFVQDGDWVIQEPGTGNIWKMFDRHFHDAYEVVE